MKEFDVSQYLNNENFQKLLMNVVGCKDEDELKKALYAFDSFFSKESGLPCIEIIFGQGEDKGTFRWDPFSIFVNESYLLKKDNIGVLGIYFHEKRHHLQYICYEKNDSLIGNSLLSEIDSYMKMDDVCIISKLSVFHGIYGYYGRLIEQDAYNYEKECMLNICKISNKLLESSKKKEILNYYKRRCDFLSDYELLHWIEDHKRRFFIRKKVEAQLLLEIKEMIRLDGENEELKRIIFSNKLFDCLNEEEKNKVSKYFKNELNDKNMRKSDVYLEKIIKKRISKEIRLENKERKKSLR